ncbi:T9SS type A sorting domain-containing protein [Aurantibacillus circumpalustris]|uniref:T9SS type A sorting domain-containing protein n=1 Tax=Aurantibacillus circumpalustris TaxID=3036359 RepID=UPI00295A7F66|nr:T9SS type A sorting domain-containing protein [Aurantibacillus circumpalustris]
MKTVLPKTFLFVLLFSMFTVKNFGQVPTISPIQGSPVICTPNASATVYSVTASNSPGSYSWSYAGPSGIVLTTVGNGAVCGIVFPPSPSGTTYTLYCYATNSSGNSATVSLVINAYETPVVSFSGAQVFCQGSSTHLSASSTIFQASSTTISYNWSPPTGLSSTNSYSVIANPLVSTNYSVLVTNGPCTATSQITVIADPCVGIIEYKDDASPFSLNIYPNPNNGSFVIKSTKSRTAVIRNELGQIVKTIYLEPNSETQVSGLNAGIYFVLSDDFKKKIIITR